MKTPPPIHDAIPFIVTTPDSGSNKEIRKFIRSHVMRGKNRKKKSLKASLLTNNHEANTPRDEPETAVSIPPKAGGEVSFSLIPDEVGPDMLDAVRTLQIGMVTVQTDQFADQVETWWLQAMFRDLVCVHFAIFVGKAYQNIVRGAGYNEPAALQYYVKTLSLLQRRVAGGDAEMVTSDETIMVVTGLAKSAIFRGNVEVAAKHLEGLKKMVGLRGGLSSFNRRLLTKVCHADIGLSLSTGRKPIFFSGDSSCNSFISPRRAGMSDPGRSTRHTPAAPSGMQAFLDTLDVRLRHVFDDLYELSRAANLATQCSLVMNGAMYEELTISAHYQLINLETEPRSVDETVRLALLAFGSTLLLQWKGANDHYADLTRKLEGALLAAPAKVHDGMPAVLTLWLYVMGYLVFDERERVRLRPALLDLLLGMGLTSWDETRASVKSVLWVNLLHDCPAEELLQPVFAVI
ncbi:hypothetical protein N0V90_012907 [Kalmusia sp. IMI 367209]|nr:hypothetical protein N0V90_012907 [Kalmusia sp. IMI 367209]